MTPEEAQRQLDEFWKRIYQLPGKAQDITPEQREELIRLEKQFSQSRRDAAAKN